MDSQGLAVTMATVSKLSVKYLKLPLYLQLVNGHWNCHVHITASSVSPYQCLIRLQMVPKWGSLVLGCCHQHVWYPFQKAVTWEKFKRNLPRLVSDKSGKRLAQCLLMWGRGVPIWSTCLHCHQPLHHQLHHQLRGPDPYHCRSTFQRMGATSFCHFMKSSPRS